MLAREQRRAQAEKHIALMNTLFAKEIQASVAGAVFYQDGQGRELALDEPRYETTQIKVKRKDIVQAALEHTGKLVIVDCASFTHPGSAYEQGSWGAEQKLCSQSILFPVLNSFWDLYYRPNRSEQRGGLFSDHSMYLPEIVFLHKGSQLKANVIVCAPPMRQRALENKRDKKECDADLERRIRCVLHIAAYNKCDTLVCGAFGSEDKAGNDPKQVARIFKDWLDKHDGLFETLIFAIEDESNFSVFNKILGKENDSSSCENDNQSTPAKEESKDDFRSIDLPEGVTLRS